MESRSRDGVMDSTYISFLGYLDTYVWLGVGIGVWSMRLDAERRG